MNSPHHTTTEQQPTVAELWASYPAATIDHPTLNLYDCVVDHARYVHEEVTAANKDISNWLVLPLERATGQLSGLIYLSNTHRQKPVYYPQMYPVGAHVVNRPTSANQVLYLVSDLDDGTRLARAGHACAVSFTPDKWSEPTLHNPFDSGSGTFTIKPPRSIGNLKHVAKEWIQAGYSVAIPLHANHVWYSEQLADTGAVILPLEAPLSLMELDEIRDHLPKLYQQATSGGEWPVPMPLDDADTPAPFPLETLPSEIQAILAELTDYYKPPQALLINSLLSVLAVAGQSLANINIDGTLKSPLSLFTVVVAESGERKSEVDRVLSKPLHEWEQSQQFIRAEQIKAAKASKKAWAAKIKGIEQAIQRATTKGQPTDQLEQHLKDLELSEPREPIIPNLLMQDQTPEGLAKSLNSYPSAGLISSEAGIVLGGHGMGKDSASRNMGMLNDLWSGQTIKISRAQSASYQLPHRRLSIGLSVQPTILASFNNGTEARGIGFFARFLLACPESNRGYRPHTKPPQWQHLMSYSQRIKTLLDMQQEPNEEHGGLELHTLDLTSEAFEIWRTGYDAIERELAPHGEFAEIADIASKTADNAARIAGLLHLYQYGLEGRVTKEEMICGIRIALWYLHEARRYFTETARPANTKDAADLERWMVSKCKADAVQQLTRREVMQGVTPKPLRKKEAFGAALAMLEAHYRVRQSKQDGKEWLLINPALLPT